MTARTPQASFKFVGVHLDNLADGRQLEPGMELTLLPAEVEHPENRRLFDEGLLLETTPDTKEGK